VMLQINSEFLVDCASPESRKPRRVCSEASLEAAAEDVCTTLGGHRHNTLVGSRPERRSAVWHSARIRSATGPEFG
jgi:hypothetical protein